MANPLKKALSLITGNPASADFLTMPKNRPLKKMTERELLSLESKIGASLFGDVSAGHRREFFCLDEKTWIWHEEWKDQKGIQQQTTTRYEVHDKGILKVQEGPRYEYIEGQELKNLVLATRLYYEKVARDIYKRHPQTGEKLA